MAGLGWSQLHECGVNHGTREHGACEQTADRQGGGLCLAGLLGGDLLQGGRSSALGPLGKRGLGPGSVEASCCGKGRRGGWACLRRVGRGPSTR